MTNVEVTLFMIDGKVFAEVKGCGQTFTKESHFETTYDAQQWARETFGESVTFKFRQSN